MQIKSKRSRKAAFSVSLTLAICLAVYLAVGVVDNRGADLSEPVPKVSDEVAHRPSAIPDRMILTWLGDPSNSQAVTWRTDITVKRGYAEIAPAGDGPSFQSQSQRYGAETQRLSTDLGPAHYHNVNFTELKPSTKYAYRVGDGTNWSEWVHFDTASDRPEPFTFVYFGDAQNDLKSHWSRVVREAYRDAPKAAFLLHAGDLVNRANRDADWGEWFGAGSFIHRMIPCIATPGNHEYEKTELPLGATERKLSYHWRPTFTFPENGPRGLEESAYWIDYQGTRIVSLNSNEQLDVQARWLETVLSDNPNTWTIVTFHHPVYSSKKGRDNPELRALWQPLFDRYKVDLVLQGHDHTYARTQLMSHENLATGVFRRSEQAGTVYVVSVSGPKMYELGRRPFMRRTAENTQLYQIIAVDSDQLRYEARTATGRLYDALTLRKRPGKVNELIEQVPDRPELR